MSTAILRAKQVTRHFKPHDQLRGFADNMSVRWAFVAVAIGGLAGLIIQQQNGTKNGNGERNILSYASKNGEFNRLGSQFRNWISNESGAEFPAEKDRYHLCMLFDIRKVSSF